LDFIYLCNGSVVLTVQVSSVFTWLNEYVLEIPSNLFCRDARTRDMVRVIGASIHSQPNPSNQDFSQGSEFLPEERTLRKEKSLGWLQRSRNAFIGAADAVRRVADRTGQALEEAKRLETLAVSGDGTVWGGLGNGVLVQWDGEGNRLQELPGATVAVKCLLAIGNHLWVGFANGKVEASVMLLPYYFRISDLAMPRVLALQWNVLNFYAFIYWK
jgi:hypothetical protein